MKTDKALLKIPFPAASVLAVDTSQKIMTVAFLRGEKTIIERVEGEKNHSALLMPAIDRILKEAGLSAGDIDCFCLVTGPGSFTGLRVGLATLKGLTFGRNAPFLALNTEELSAYYESGKAEDFFNAIKQKAESGNFLSAPEVELLYENPETKRFKY